MSDHSPLTEPLIEQRVVKPHEAGPHHRRDHFLHALSRWLFAALVVVAMIAGLPSTADPIMLADPPFVGTIFIDPDIITSADATAFQAISANGQGMRTMFDRRVNAFITVNAYLFNATFDNGLTAEIQVNPEFGSVAAAQEQAQKYGEVIGRLPTVLRSDVQTVWIHLGTEPFGGGNNNLLIHTGQSALYEADGILEETLVHEAAHTSLDATHAAASGWVDAQQADAMFISTYARDNPTGEDIAESFLPYLAVRYRSARISESLASTITETIPNRIAYFDALQVDIRPLQPDPPLSGTCDGKLVTIDMSTNGGIGTGTAGVDVILGTSGVDVIDAGAGDDTVCGLGGDDTISGGDGDDVLLAGNGDDQVFGGEGKDRIRGQNGDDLVNGQGGNDNLNGNNGDDEVNGGDGHDYVAGNDGYDTVTGGDGTDTVNGGGKSDVLRGGRGNDTLNGNGFADTIYGSTGNDIIKGGDGPDMLFGENGNDNIDGNRGNDTISGAAGFDTCTGRSGYDTQTGCEIINSIP